MQLKSVLLIKLFGCFFFHISKTCGHVTHHIAIDSILCVESSTLQNKGLWRIAIAMATGETQKHSLTNFLHSIQRIEDALLTGPDLQREAHQLSEQGYCFIPYMHSKLNTCSHNMEVYLSTLAKKDRCLAVCWK